MRSFTFLRLTPEMITPAYQGAWMRFMHASSLLHAGMHRMLRSQMPVEFAL